MYKCKRAHNTFMVLQLSFHPNHCNIWLLIWHSRFYIHTYHNTPVKQRTDSQPQHLQNQKSVTKSCTSSPWHISDRL